MSWRIGISPLSSYCFLVNLIKYDFQWAGDNKKAFVDKFTNEIAAADKLK